MGYGSHIKKIVYLRPGQTLKELRKRVHAKVQNELRRNKDKEAIKIDIVSTEKKEGYSYDITFNKKEVQSVL